ncbi:MAG: FAD-dependent oxidoreductase [Brevundimonas sp.]|uniref:NAD(P)/FAD-dependent oxidoreductase n=1 Tax=Brevundimonas sp. TaxID=1871086 RepID=UPI00271CD6AE|nr:FAD-dependent oxidoreductase [Brevundimonas sp.]MDO9587657.1 FAD-dependent oxidoreductase [Brevundimonas sp.]
MATSPDVIVIGAGVLGLCTAAELAERGHVVTVIDPGVANASSIAAGMIAPALESLLEEVAPARAALLKRARDLWPAFAETHALRLHREGADWRGPDAGAAIARLHALGFDAREAPGGLTTADDWRIEVGPALTALARTPGLTVTRGRVIRLAGDARRWRVEADDGRVWFSASVVLATGVETAIAGLPGPVAAMVGAITPIRGQLSVVAMPAPPRVVRGPGVYVAPCEGGVVIGATMEPGRRDLDPDPAEAARQVAAGLALLGAKGEAGPARVGVRGATADGLPLAGSSGQPGLHLALAPRRNGWLMGPLAALVVADGIEGRVPLADATALDPLRFG